MPRKPSRPPADYYPLFCAKCRHYLGADDEGMFAVWQWKRRRALCGFCTPLEPGAFGYVNARLVVADVAGAVHDAVGEQWRT